MSGDNEFLGVVKDEYFEKIKASAKAPVVEKSEFAAFSSSIPDDHKIFSFEGRDDKVVYDHWIRRIAAGLKYEPYVSKNKRANLHLFDSLCRDLTGLADRVYFFVDRDFDDLQGRAAHDRLFLTEKYSVENYLVCDRLLDEILKVEFHCNGHLNARANVVARFKRAYNQFLSVTRDVNFRLFVAAREGIRRLEDVPGGVGSFANVTLDDVTAVNADLTDIVKLEREPTQDEMARWRTEFDELEPEGRYRGKFALAFFVKWLTLLRQDRLSGNSVCFLAIPLPDYGVKGNFSFDSLAPRAAYPAGLEAFLARA